MLYNVKRKVIRVIENPWEMKLVKVAEKVEDGIEKTLNYMSFLRSFRLEF